MQFTSTFRHGTPLSQKCAAKTPRRSRRDGAVPADGQISRICAVHTPMQKFAADRLRPEGKKNGYIRVCQ
ncbi:MAG: hypothetical protein ACRETZ_14130 [Steroidobacteraceae bacterium]